MSMLTVLAQPALDAEAGTLTACVSTEPACEQVACPGSASQSGFHYFEGGAMTQGEAYAIAAGIGAQIFAKTQLGGPATVSAGSEAHFVDQAVSVQLPLLNVPSVTLRWNFKVSGSFSGSDFGPPCDHCGGQSPWSSSASMEAKGIVGSGPTLQQVTAPATWNSNDGLVSGSENVVLPMEITIAPGVSFQWGIHVTVGAVAENYPCRVGAGTCGLDGGALANANFKDTALFRGFHLFDSETGGEITDFTLTGSGGIDYLAIDHGCGNGTLGDGEQCDDGNLTSGDCCSVSCKLEQGNCDDADACTSDGICEDGVCAGAAPISCPPPCGDANDSGTVTAVDALFALRTAVGTSECESCRCDVNDDSSVTASDALKLLQSAVGQTVLLKCAGC